MDNKMVESFGECCCCHDTCILVNEVKKNGNTQNIVTCAKNSSKILQQGTAKFCCESCLERFNTGKRIKEGQIVQ